MKLTPFVTREEFEKTIGIEAGNQVFEYMFSTISVFRKIERILNHVEELDEKIDLLYKHLGLTIKTIDATPEKKVVEKYVPPLAENWSMRDTIERVREQMVMVPPKRKRGRPRKAEIKRKLGV